MNKYLTNLNFTQDIFTVYSMLNNETFSYLEFFPIPFRTQLLEIFYCSNGKLKSLHNEKKKHRKHTLTFFFIAHGMHGDTPKK